MVAWLADNWLALYRAIVGTVALGLRLAQFRHSVKSARVSLEVSCEESSDYQRNLDLLQETEISEPYNRPELVAVYTVKVSDVGTVGAYIQSAGLVTETGERRETLVKAQNDSMMLQSVLRSSQEPLDAKSSRCFSV